MDSSSNDEKESPNRRESTLTRRSVLRTAGAGAVALTAAVGGSVGVSVAESAGGDGARTAANESEGEAEDGSGEAPEFHCSYVELDVVDVMSKDVRVTFADGSYVATFSGAPSTLGSPGRVVDAVTIDVQGRDETTYENPDPDCDPGERATTFTCRSVTVGCDEFARSGGTPPDEYVEAVLAFADGTTERRDPPTDPTGTFRGTGENEGKRLAEFRLYHEAFRTAHVWQNPHVDAEPSVD